MAGRSRAGAGVERHRRSRNDRRRIVCPRHRLRDADDGLLVDDQVFSLCCRGQIGRRGGATRPCRVAAPPRACGQRRWPATGVWMPQDIERFVARLKSAKRRMPVSDDDLLEMVWQVHPRFHFFKSLPWGANLLDLGAGDGGLAHWKGWLKPQRPDLNLYGVDLSPGAHKDLYSAWESINLDREQPSFPGVQLNAFLANRLIEYLAAPEMIVAWLGSRAPLGAQVYLEWASPSSLALPTREQ